jgi:hypothetical protein
MPATNIRGAWLTPDVPGLANEIAMIGGCGSKSVPVWLKRCKRMRMMILTGLLAMALLGAVLAAVSVGGSSWMAHDSGIHATERLNEAPRDAGPV